MDYGYSYMDDLHYILHKMLQIILSLVRVGKQNTFYGCSQMRFHPHQSHFNTHGCGVLDGGMRFSTFVGAVRGATDISLKGSERSRPRSRCWSTSAPSPCNSCRVPDWSLGAGVEGGGSDNLILGSQSSTHLIHFGVFFIGEGYEGLNLK